MRLGPVRIQQLAPLSDEDIAARVVAGDAGAFELLMRRHNQLLFRTARSILSNETDAEDALQEAYIRIYAGLDGFEEKSKLKTWMTRIVFNESIRFRERRSNTKGRERSGLPLISYDSGGEPLEPAMSSSKRMQMFDEAMELLTERERSVVMLRVIQGLSTRETAASLGMSESNVKISFFRAKPKLACALKGAGLKEVRQELSFDGQRCDRLVAAVFRQLEPGPEGVSATPSGH